MRSPLVVLRSFVTALLMTVALATGGRAFGAGAGIVVEPEWHEALLPLRGMPVQDTGFIRTTFTFAENYISAISGRRKVGNADAMEAMLFLLKDKETAASIPLIKLSHPELVKIYGAPRISANQWRDEQYREKLMGLLQEDQEKWLKVLNGIEYRAGLLEDVEGEFAIVPREKEWLTPAEALTAGNLDSIDNRILEQWGALRAGLTANDAKAAGAAARELSQAVTAASQQLTGKMPNLSLDLFYHTHQPFRNSAVFYLFAALTYGAALLLAKPKLNWAAYGLLGLGLAEQVVGVTVRWILAGRAPLSNMYESFTFAVGGMVLIAMILEGMRVTRLAGLAASVLGFIFMVIAHKAPIFDSAIRPLMPALQSSWLTYHVVTIMLSYSAFALSFFVSLIYLTKDWFAGGDSGTGLLARRLPDLRSLDIFTYRIIGVGFPLLTLGIIFGAVWAATAWGRPWGFDPKETWSAITWLIYAIYLHVRFLAGWSGRRAAVLSLLGFLAVLFTYLGVNYLLPGLHSYV